MATVTIHKPMNVKPLALLVLALAVLLLALSRPSQHAVETHKGNAWSATRRMGDIDPDDDDVWSETCRDGRKYTFKLLRNNDGKFAVAVSIDDPITGDNITRFVCTSKNWIAQILKWCGS